MTEPTEPEIDLLDEDDDTFEEAATGQAPAGDDDLEIFEMPKALAGVIFGHCCEAKLNPQNDNQWIIEFKSEEAGTKGSRAAVFVKLDDGDDMNQLKGIARALGRKVVQQPGGGFGIAGGVKSFKNKSCYFVVNTYKKKDGGTGSGIARGMPKDDDKAPEWRDYKKAANLNAAQLAAIKSSPGVIATDTWRKL